MPEFLYQDPFPQGKDVAKYRLLTKEYVSVSRFNGKEVLVIDPEGLAFLAHQAFRDVSYLLPPGVPKTYTEENLRYSQTIPLTMYEEKNSGTNLPAQIDLYATEGPEYKFLFVAKGGGSANKTYLFQETKALLNPASLEKFLVEKMKTLGTAACPPYHLAFAVGGTSAEVCLKTVKLASTGYLDHLPTKGNDGGQAVRDLEMEERILKAAHRSGYGAQFGGKS